MLIIDGVNCFVTCFSIYIVLLQRDRATFSMKAPRWFNLFWTFCTPQKRLCFILTKWKLREAQCIKMLQNTNFDQQDVNILDLRMIAKLRHMTKTITITPLDEISCYIISYYKNYIEYEGWNVLNFFTINIFTFLP